MGRSSTGSKELLLHRTDRYRYYCLTSPRSRQLKAIALLQRIVVDRTRTTYHPSFISCHPETLVVTLLTSISKHKDVIGKTYAIQL